MQSTTPTDENVTAHSTRPRYIFAFRDDLDREHIYRTADETVHVIYNCRRRQIIDLYPPWFDIETYRDQLAEDHAVERVELQGDAGDAVADQLGAEE